MTSRRTNGEVQRSGNDLRVGLFGNLGSGNIGNDGSLEALVNHLRAAHPDVTLGFMCAGPQQVTARYRVSATRLQWYSRYDRGASGAAAIVLKAMGKAFDVIRTAAWARRFDVVIVPGMGVLEASVPLRPWAFPYSLFVLCATARLSGCKVALVSVGADVIERPSTRWLITRAAKLAYYRSYRDAHSMESMSKMGVNTSGDSVYLDLAFALPVPSVVAVDNNTVGVGVMAYQGGDEDRAQSPQIYAAYVGKLKRFVRWLVDNDRRVRLFTGDRVDDEVVTDILSDVRAYRPHLDPSTVVGVPTPSLDELMRQLSGVGTVVATRYHSLVCALKLSKPTVSIGYAAKHDALMENMGLADFCEPARDLDVNRLVERFVALESRREELRKMLVERNLANARLLEHQFVALSSALFGRSEPAAGAEGNVLSRSEAR